MKVLLRILDILFPQTDIEALAASASIETLGALVAPVPVETDIVALLPYRTPIVKAVIVEAKFKDREHAHRLLGTVLHDYLADLIADTDAWSEQTYVLIPIPLSRTRHASRGYNQVGRVARFACEGLPRTELSTDLLKRTRDTVPQTSLSGEARRRNLEGAFEVNAPLNPAYTFIVLDDVVTTGATLQAAITCLKEAGAKSVLGLSLAH